jgi:hypothetical protein
MDEVISFSKKVTCTPLLPPCGFVTKVARKGGPWG